MGVWELTLHCKQFFNLTTDDDDDDDDDDEDDDEDDDCLRTSVVGLSISGASAVADPTGARAGAVCDRGGCGDGTAVVGDADVVPLLLLLLLLVTTGKVAAAIGRFLFRAEEMLSWVLPPTRGTSANNKSSQASLPSPLPSLPSLPPVLL